MVKAKKFVYTTPFVGEPKVTDFELVEEELPAVGDNGKISKCFVLWSPTKLDILQRSWFRPNT